MNIKEAKQEVKNAMMAYFAKDENDNYIIPIEKQRPVFLMGPPGIGKTQIMEQIANELDVGLVSYSMTHHTRQSLLGLPMISKKTYDGRECAVSEYTMSEIIASVYDYMEETGKREGILFVDEINCVSETLAPIMLQFLQYKMLGKHTVPNGWIVVTAGNPPEYNDSVREFDTVTWDRLKRIDISPDYSVWKEYAYERGVHPAIIAYLNMSTDSFYRIESTVLGNEFVTARGWDDLSQMMKIYEAKGIEIDDNLISQYVQNHKIASDFATYYALFKTYDTKYNIEQILDGTYSDEDVKLTQNSDFSEKYAIVGIIIDKIANCIHNYNVKHEDLRCLMTTLKQYRSRILGDNALDVLDNILNDEREKLISLRAINSSEDAIMVSHIIDHLEHIRELTVGNESDAFAIAKKYFDGEVALHEKVSHDIDRYLDNIFTFTERAFSARERSILVLEFTVNKHIIAYISKHGCAKYHENCKNLLINDRQREIETELTKLSVDFED